MLPFSTDFYKSPTYLGDTKKDFASLTPLTTSYRWNSEHKVLRITKKIFSLLFFPLILGKCLHNFAGKIAYLPAASSFTPVQAETLRSEVNLNGDWKYKRLTVKVDGIKIDAMVVGKESTLNNKRWMLHSVGNGDCYENNLHFANNYQMLEELQSNALFFNYSGVGSSSGKANRKAMKNAYRAMLKLLEDENMGIGAKEIIGYGHSIGAGVQGDALKSYRLKKDINYVFVKSRTFSRMSKEASLMARPLGFVTKLLGWNISSVTSSRKLQAHEIILQTTNVTKPEELNDSSKIIDDGVIFEKATLAKKLLDKGIVNNKTFFGIPEGHNTPIDDTSFFTDKINEILVG